MNIQFFTMNNLLLILLLAITMIPVSAQSSTYDFENSYSSEYILLVDEHSFTVPYSVDAQILAMTIDSETNSLLIGLENTCESLFRINLNTEIISAESNEFVVLANGYEVDYSIINNSDNLEFLFYVPDCTEEVEIIGTHVIPEFPFGSIVVFVALITMVMIFTKLKLSMFKL